MKWHYVKDLDVPKEPCGCLCDLRKTYEVLCYDPESNTWYDSWGDQQVASLDDVEKWISLSEINKVANE